MVPPYLFTDILLIIAASVYGGGGFGDKFFVESAFLIIVIFRLVTARKWEVLLLSCLLITCIILPALMQSSILLAAVLLQGRRYPQAILVLLGTALQLVGAINPFYLPLFLIPPSIVMMLFQPWLAGKQVSNGLILGLLAINISPVLLNIKAPEAHQSFAYPYRVDVAKMAKVSAPGVTYSSIDDHGNRESSEIYVLEHDPGHGLANFNWSQKRLWTQNQYYGSELLRVATALDGYLYSNLGCRVDDSGIRLLGEAHRSEFNSFISKKGGRLTFSDSDFLTNGAVGFQRNLIDALFRRWSISHFIVFGSSVCCLLALWARQKGLSTVLIVVVAIGACLAERNSVIDIRIVDDRSPWPHSKGVGGMASEVSEERGIKTVGRVGKAVILGIARDGSAKHGGEKVIVMEGGSKVTIGSKSFQALDQPLGDTDGIVDAIPIQETGGSPGKCVQRVGNIVLIGTNSARKNWQMIYDSSK